jgi:alpha-galactosidase/6-phospho-beta-glucosidase family protein
VGTHDNPGRRIERGLARGTLVLHDIKHEALRDMHEWGTRALDVAKADLKLEKTQRLEEALRGLTS